MSGMWEVRQLGDLVEILDTKRKPITKRDRNPGEFPYYGATGIVDYVDGYIFDEQLILLGEDGAKWNSGDQSAFIITGKTWVNNHAHVLKPYRDVLDDQWLVYNLNHQNLLSFVTGLTVPKLNQGQTKKIPIPVPPLKEQKQIVAKLDQAFEVIDKAKANTAKNLENAKQLFQSKLNEIFSQKGNGWVDGVLIDVAKVVNGYAFKSGDFSTSNSIKSIKITNVGVGKFVEEDDNYLPKEYSKKHQAVTISQGDMVLALTRTIISGGLKIAKVPESYDGALLNQRVAGIKVDESLMLIPILHYFFQSKIVSDYVLSNVNTLMQPNLSIKDLKMMPIPIPPMSEQNRISLI
ncbi:hypothetical protein HOB87_04460, partial [Candidatus Woesearchaeota archaeon]|jgi:type I restriction enzyme, S subunit|nr:hypothetical protein [Candidatus Woesearchaeota archaeon]